MQTTTYKLNITPGGVPLTIHISQYDVGLRQYIFQPYTSEGEFTYVTGATVTLEATKPDGYAVIHNCTYNQDGSIAYTVQEQLAAKAGRVWSKVVIRNGNNILGTGAVVWMVDNAGVKDNAIVSDSDISALQQWMTNVEDYSEAAASSASMAESAVTSAQAAATQAAGYVDQAVILGGTPLVAATVSAMSDHDRVYVYTGSETGYTAGNWYYWNGSAWTSGGIYNSSAVQTDPTLSVSGMAADAAATGELKNETEGVAYACKYFDDINYVANSYIVISGTSAGSFASYNGWKRSNLILLKGASKLSVKNTGANGSSYNAFYDANKVFISSFSFSTGNTDISVPQNAEYYAVSGSNANMDASTFVRVWVTNKSPIESMYEDEKIAEDVGYAQIKDLNPPDNLYTKTCTSFGGSSVTGESATITAVNQGIQTNPFESNSNVVRVTAKITFTTPNVYVLAPYYANGSWEYGNLLSVGDIESGIEFSFDFDASYYAVYHSAEKFRFIFQTRSETGVSDYSGIITITSLSIQSLDVMRQSEYYDDYFLPMMEKVFGGINEAKSLPLVSNIMTAPNGDKYFLAVNNNGEVVAVPVIPDKTLFCGNSLLLGMNTTASNHNYVYGMCASAPNEDYAHKVMNAIVSANVSATYDRVHGAAFEALGTADSFSTLWNTTNNVYTGEPMKNSFTSDLDLIIIQLSDNVNTADRRTAFANNIDDFITAVRTASPNARLLWVYGWFYNDLVASIIETTCRKQGIQTINIRSLHTTANEGTSGQSYITGSGTTGTVSDNWITHPGNDGFTAIANKILATIGV